MPTSAYLVPVHRGQLTWALALAESILAYEDSDTPIVLVAPPAECEAVNQLPIPHLQAVVGDPGSALAELRARFDHVIELAPTAYIAGKRTDLGPASRSGSAGTLHAQSGSFDLLGLRTPRSIARLERRDDGWIADGSPLLGLDMSGADFFGTGLLAVEADPRARWSSSLLPLLVRYVDAMGRAEAVVRSFGLGATLRGRRPLDLRATLIVDGAIRGALSKRGLSTEPLAGPWSIHRTEQLRPGPAVEPPPRPPPAPPVPIVVEGRRTRSSIKVSALVSTYRAERYLAGCLDDL
ncbi:MAG: hypothetical protein AAGA56_14310, partial [Myxococcota bacterium]